VLLPFHILYNLLWRHLAKIYQTYRMTFALIYLFAEGCLYILKFPLSDIIKRLYILEVFHTFTELLCFHFFVNYYHRLFTVYGFFHSPYLYYIICVYLVNINII